MKRKCLHTRKTSRRLPYIDATFKVQFFHGFQKRESSLMHIVIPGNVQLLVHYLTNEYEFQLQETQSDTPRDQVTRKKSHLLRKNKQALATDIVPA